MKVSKSTIIRAVLLVIALINVGLEMTGRSILPIDEELVSEFISLAFLIGASVVGYWKNNSFTPEAIEADVYLNGLREGESINE